MDDIRLNDDWGLTRATNGDAPIVSGIECILQDIRLEAITQEGELFFDESYGWSLMDFIHETESDMVKMEIERRIKSKLETRDLVRADSIKVESIFKNDLLHVLVQFVMDSKAYQIQVALNRVEVQVI